MVGSPLRSASRVELNWGTVVVDNKREEFRGKRDGERECGGGGREREVEGGRGVGERERRSETDRYKSEGGLDIKV